MKYNFEKYIGIKYQHKGRDFSGVDCYGLCYLVFKTEKNIILPDFSNLEYSYDLKEPDEECLVPTLIDSYGKEIMKIVQFPYKPFDIPIFYGGNGNYTVANHMGLFTSDMSFLHISSRTKSVVDKMNDYYMSKIYKVLRYNG